MRFRLSPPNDSHVSAVYNVDAGLDGSFVEVLRRRKVTKTYDLLTPEYNVERRLEAFSVSRRGGLLHGELHEALAELCRRAPCIGTSG